MALGFQVSIPTDFSELEEKILQVYSDEISQSLKDNTPGKAAQNWKVTGPAAGTVTISNDAKHLPFLEKGTGLYGPGKTLITPKTATMLSWMEGNRRIFAHSTKGMPAQPFLKDAIAEGMRTAKEDLNGNV